MTDSIPHDTGELEPWVQELIEANAGGGRMTAKQIRIVQSAVEIFAEKGYSGAATSEIAQRAGVAEGTIFRHYKTKKDLLLSIVTPAMVRILAPFVLREFRSVLDGEFATYEQFLRAFIVNRLLFLQKNKRLLKIVVQELPFHPELQAQFKEVILSKVLGRLTKIVDRFKAEGQLADLPNLTIMRLSASAVVGYVLGHTLNEGRSGAPWNDEAELEATIRFVLKGLAP